MDLGERLRASARWIAAALVLVSLMVPELTSAQQPTPSASPAPTLPDTVAGRALGAWLEAFNSGDEAKYRAYVQTWEPSRLNALPGMMRFRSMTGGFDLRAVESSTPTQIVAILEDRNNEQFARGNLSVTATQPYRVTTFPLEAIPTPPQFAPAHLNVAELAAATKARLDSMAAAGTFSGAVMIAQAGQPVFTAAYGMADRAKNVPNTLDTRFRIGSMNKMFTAVAVMQLVQSGKVSLDAPFGTYVKDYPNKEMASQVTVAQLLSHTGGTGDIFGPEFDKNRLQLKTLDDYERVYGSRPLAFKPGTKFEYSNYGFEILGMVVERASGENYYDYVRTHVFLPAGMTSTGSEPEDVPDPMRSIGYTRDDNGSWVNNADTLPYRGTPAGGGYSTVGDLVRFGVALQNGTLLDAAHFTTLTTPKIDEPGGGKYAYGFGVDTVGDNLCFGHNGGAPGQNGGLEICPKAGFIVTALANIDPPAASSVVDYATSRLPLPASP